VTERVGLGKFGGDVATAGTASTAQPTGVWKWSSCRAADEGWDLMRAHVAVCCRLQNLLAKRYLCTQPVPYQSTPRLQAALLKHHQPTLHHNTMPCHTTSHIPMFLTGYCVMQCVMRTSSSLLTCRPPPTPAPASCTACCQAPENAPCSGP
jgi:hypothetical protein